jgi:hypothetical protein
MAFALIVNGVKREHAMVRARIDQAVGALFDD